MAPSIKRFALRADVTGCLKEKLSRYLGKVANAFIVVCETAEGENEHIHAIFNSEKTLKAVRNEFTRTCDAHKGNKMYSLKECNDDFDAYIRYICKGVDKKTPPDVWYHQGLDYSKESIARAHEMYYVNQDAVKENSKKRKKAEGNMVEQVERVCKERGYKSYEREMIAEVYMDIYRDARKGINVFAARAVVNTVCLLLDNPECQRKDLARKIADL